MVVTLDAAGLAAALRIGDSAEELAEATRLLDYASTAITRHVETCPDAIHNEAVRRLAGYLLDQPEAGRGDAYANALRNSGAAAMMLPWRIHTAGGDAVAEAQAAVGTPGNPVIDVTVTGGQLVVTFADGSSQSQTLPSGGADTVAREAADNAQSRADDAYVKAEGAETTAEGAESTAETTETGLEGHIAQHPGAVHGGPPAAFEAKLAGETALTSSIDTVATVAASDLTAGQKYRITGAVYVRAIGGTIHNLDGYLYAGTVQIATGETVVDPEGSSQARFSMVLDTLFTMPSPAVAITLRAKEGIGDSIIARPPTGLIVMEVS